MHNLTRKVTIGVLTALLMVPAGSLGHITASAASKTKVLKVSKLKKTSYLVSSGYLYTSDKLTKKAHNARNYLHTTFYAYDAATVRKSNGKKAVYYYIKNKSGSVKGWIWHGNLVKPKSYKQQQSDINAMIKIIQGMSQPVKDSTLILFNHMDVKHPYNTNYDRTRNLSHIVFQARIKSSYGTDNSVNNADANGIIKMYQLFKGRFSANDNALLTKYYNNYDDVMNNKALQANGNQFRMARYDALSNIADYLSTFLDSYDG